jgi:hypothetical protein
MKRLGRLFGVVLALGGFVAAHVLVQVGNAQVPPLPTVTVTTAVPVPTVTAPVPVPPSPTVTTPTVPVPTPPPTPTPTVTVPTLPPPPTVTAPPAPAPPPAPKPPPATSVPAVPPTTTPLPVAPAVPTMTPGTVAAPSSGAPPSSGTSSPASGSRSASGSSAEQSFAGGGEAPAPGRSVVVIGGAPSSAASSSSPSGASPYGATTSAARATAAAGVAGAPQAVLGARKLEGKRVRTRGGVKVRLEFTLSRAARLFLIVRGPSPSCRVAGYIPVKGHKGKNTVIFAGRAQGHPLGPGVYLLSLSTTRSFTPGAPSEYVQVVSPRRAVPLPDSASKPACAEVTAAPASFTTTWVSLVRARPQTGTAVATSGSKRPTAQIASAQNDSDGEDAAGLLPSLDDGALGGVTSSANEHPLAAIAMLTLIAALLFAMVALVTRFLRGSWNP